MSGFITRILKFLDGLIISLIVLLSVCSCVWCSNSSIYKVGIMRYFFNWLVLDKLCYLMSLLTIVLWFILWIIGVKSLVLRLSVFSGLVTYITTKALIFWVFYELCIICTLYMLVVKSSYPERYLSSWYFGGYILLSSVPMLVCVCFISLYRGSFKFVSWPCFGVDKNINIIYIILLILFLTKIPVFPFHGWLPLVHAEARSPVRVILRGYIMKLGLVGLVRMCYRLVVRHMNVAIIIVLSYSVMFLIASMFEYDAKRWLAFLRLSHILLSICILISSRYLGDFYRFSYCFGHGLSVASAFLVIWWGYEIRGSRMWKILVKIIGGGFVLHVISGIIFLNICSFPPTLQFFGELWAVVGYLPFIDWFGLFFIIIYIFSGRLIGFIMYGLIICSPLELTYGYKGGLDHLLSCSLYLSLVNLLFFIVV